MSRAEDAYAPRPARDEVKTKLPRVVAATRMTPLPLHPALAGQTSLERMTKQSLRRRQKQGQRRAGGHSRRRTRSARCGGTANLLLDSTSLDAATTRR